MRSFKNTNAVKIPGLTGFVCGLLLMSMGCTRNQTGPENVRVENLKENTSFQQAPAYDDKIDMNDAYLSKISDYYQRIAAHKSALQRQASDLGDAGQHQSL